MKTIMCKFLFVYGIILILQNECGMDVKMLRVVSIIKKELALLKLIETFFQLTGLHTESMKIKNEENTHKKPSI